MLRKAPDKKRIDLQQNVLRIMPETYSEPSRTSKMEPFAKTVYGFQPLAIFAKSSILDV